MKITFQALAGARALPFIDNMARLRLKVFSEWPYLYKGDLEYERKYLRTYFRSRHSLVVLAMDGQQVVGASTAIWLKEAEGAFQAAFRKKQIPLNSVCYYGESVLMPEYRGLGIGKMFMQLRESFARSLPQVTTSAFCAVIREPNHKMRPASYMPLDAFWTAQGFKKAPGMKAEFTWRDHGQKKESVKKLQFWLKPLKLKARRVDNKQVKAHSRWGATETRASAGKGLTTGTNMGTKLIKKYYEAFNQQDWSEMLSLVHERVQHDINQGRTEVGRGAFKKFLKVMDEHYDERVEKLVVLKGEGKNRFAAEFEIHGVYKKSQKGLPKARGQSYRIPVGAFFEVSGGKIARVTNYYNLPLWMKCVR